jgi:predicted MFS family arabinose efflux permease
MMTRSPSPLRRRLLPLHVAVALQGFLLWVPVEKLFMTGIGFDPAAVGVMAAAYAAVVPVVEIPSGILADRWSRRGVLVVASVALALCSLVGGLSHGVPVYVVSALILGVYFAMYSGTMDSIVYDTVLEETGGSADFETRIGRVRATESVALVTGALAGGLVADLTSPRLTYFLTVPFAAASVLAYLRFREPTLHRTLQPTPLRQHLAVTFRTLARRRELVPVIALIVLTALLLQSVFEFGPLWLVALAAPAAAFGPYWAALMSTFGIGGLVAGRIPFDRPLPLAAVVVLMTGAGLAVTVRTNAVVVTVAHVILALLLVAVGIHATRLLHDRVPSTVRAGVASGVGALSWLVFLPFALAMGLVSDAFGVHAAGWLLTGAAATTGLLLVVSAALSDRARGEAAPVLVPPGEMR